MTLIEISLFLLMIALWSLAAWLHLATISHSALSNFEIDRRAKSGEESFQKLQQQQKLRPRLVALKTIFKVLALVLALFVTIKFYGLVGGLVVGCLLMLFVPIVTRLRGLHNFLQQLWDKYEPDFFNLTKKLPWLGWFSYETSAPESKIASKEELSQVISKSELAVDKHQIKSLQSVLKSSQLKVADVMTLIDDVVTINHDETLGPLVLDELHKTGHRRFPVINKKINDIIGVLYIDENIELQAAKSTVKEAMDKVVYFIKQDGSLDTALRGFLQTARHLFIVVDEQDKPVGVLSLRDVVDALLGKDTAVNYDQLDLIERKTR